MGARRTTEKILVYGKWGTGKSYQFLKIAEFVAPTRCYVIDSDDSYPRLLETEFTHLDNIELYQVSGWPEWREAISDIVFRVRPGDWVCVDRADLAWEAVQDYYTTEVFGEDAGDYFLAVRKEMEAELRRGEEKKVLQVFEGDKDWQVINRLYRQHWLKLVTPGFPAHLYFTASEKQVEKRDKADIKRDYGWIGYHPAGQKHLPHQVHTVLRFSIDGDEWEMTTVNKDRGRRRLDHQKLVSFPLQYLVGVAGWE